MLLEEAFGFAQTLLSEDHRSRLVGPASSAENAEQGIIQGYRSRREGSISQLIWPGATGAKMLGY